MKPKAIIFNTEMRAENISADKIHSFRLLNDKLFSVASTGLSHRKINALETNDIIRSGRKDNKKWRKFSYKERIFLLIITELRKYGLRDKQLKHLRDAFFKKANVLASDIVIAEVLEENKVVLLVDSDGSVSFHSLIHLDENYTSFININLNAIVESLRKELGAKKKLNYITSADILTNLIPSEKERKIMKIIRDKEYRTITITKKDKEPVIINAEMATILDEKAAFEMIKTKDYGEIHLVKRDRKIVSIKIEDTFKI